MRRLVCAFACLLALACGFLIPVIAFGDEGTAGIVAHTGIDESFSVGKGAAGAESERWVHLAAGLVALAIQSDQVTVSDVSAVTTTETEAGSTRETTEPTSATTTTDGIGAGTSTSTDTGSGDTTESDESTPSTATTGTTPAGTPTTGTTTSATTSSATTAGTTTAGTTTAGTTTGDEGKGTAKAAPHQRRTEWIAALLSLAIFIGILVALNAALIQTAHASTKANASSSRWYPSTVVERSPILRFLLLGDDGRWALSKTLASVWTAVLVWAIATLALSDLFGAKEGWEEFAKQGVSWQYLLLLGGPVGASISAQALTLIRSQSGVEVKTEPPEGASLTQLYTDDWGKLELIDVQYLTFNCLSIVVFLVVFCAGVSDGLPVFPEVLAALTAATAGGYVARRAAMRADPSITSISPPAAAPGELVQLWGVNLTPARERTESDDSEHQVEVFFDGLRASEVDQASEQTSDLHESYTVRVPAGATPKDGVQVIVNSGGARGLKSDPYTEFKILAPTLANIEPPRVSPGATVTLWGAKLLSDRDGDLRVFFSDLAGSVTNTHRGDDSSQDVIEVKVPELAAGAVKVKLINGHGQSSNELDLTVTADVRIVEAPEVLSLGPETPSLLIKGQGFVTQPGPPLLAAVYLDGHPLIVDEGAWRPGEVTAKLPTSPDDLKRLGFTAKDDAQLVVRNDQGHSSEPWPLKLTVAASPAS